MASMGLWASAARAAASSRLISASAPEQHLPSLQPTGSGVVWDSLILPQHFPPGQFLIPACAQALGFCPEAWESGQGGSSPSLHGLLVPPGGTCPAASPPPLPEN